MSRVDWSAPDAETQAVAILNQGIVDYVSAYQRGGTDALGDVLDKKQPRSRSQEYRTLLANSPYLIEYMKEFHDYLASYPKGTAGGRRGRALLDEGQLRPEARRVGVPPDALPRARAASWSRTS